MDTTLRQFEVRQANRLLEAMQGQADDSEVVAFMGDLAALAGISRVQAQVGLRTLTTMGRIVVEARGARGTPGRFKIINATPVRRSDVDGDAGDVMSASRNRSATHGRSTRATYTEEAGSLQEQELEALRRENAALRDRLRILEQRLELSSRSGHARAGATG